MNIIKRSGKIEALSKKKIFDSICNANGCVKDDEKLTQKQIKRIAESVYSFCENLEEPIEIDVLEDVIEKKLMEASGYEVAKRYITYRYEKERVRMNKSLTEKLTASNVQNQNANMDEFSFGGRIGETAAYVTKQYALDHLISKKTKGNHVNNEIYIHDLDNYAVGSHNCLSIPFDKLLKEGFTTRQADVRPASSINTAMQLVAVIFQIQSLQQFGGVSATHLDWTMVPYVRKSFRKHILDGIRYIEKNLCDGVFSKNVEDMSIEDPEYVSHKDAYRYAMDKTLQELNQAVEGMYHNLNTLQSRSGGQLPFSSLNAGTCTLPEGRMTIRALLDGCLSGCGKHHTTSIFPCLIFQCMKGVNRKPGDPNYDLFKLALKSTATRIYPNYANVDWSGNEGYDPENPCTYFSTMGALAGHEHLYIRLNHGDPIDMSIKDFFNLCAGDAIKGRPMQLYYNRKPLDIPTDPDWRHNQTRSMGDTVLEEAGVYRITHINDDVSYIGSSANIQQRFRDHKKCIRHNGGLDSGVNFGDSDPENYKFEVLEYTDDYRECEKKYISTMANVNFKGISTKYYKNVGLTKGKGLLERPSIRMDPNVPQDFIDLSDRDIMVLDRGSAWVKVKHVFRNDKMNTPLMMHVSYKEFDKEYTLCCTEDHPLWTGNGFTKASELKIGDTLYRGDGEPLTVTKVFYSVDRTESFDIGTETGSFIGSDIIMHNCRTANGWDINCDDPKLGQLKDGRGNICPTTIILPTLAMQAKTKSEKNSTDIVEEFMKILEKKIGEAKDSLIERFDWICSQPPAAAKFMYENGTMYGYKPEEGIRSALKHGTLAIGQLGLAEALQVLIGCDHSTKKGMDLAIKIESLFKDKCAKFKKEYKLNFGVYYTPAENLCFTAMKKFREAYGIIKNVSDHDYFTNSMHIPVWKKMDAFKKIDLESQLTKFSSAGCITYVELDASVKNNLDAMEELVNYAMDKDIPYFAINVPIDTCECGYQGDLGEKCPKCGSTHIQRLRRVTGYITGNYTTAFNPGKQKEVEERAKHTALEVK